MIFFRGDVSVYILYSFTFKIFCYEFLKIHLEIVLNKLKSSMRDALSDFIWKRTKRRPMILPIIEEV